MYQHGVFGVLILLFILSTPTRGPAQEPAAASAFPSVHILRAGGRFADLLNRGKQQTDPDSPTAPECHNPADDKDDDQRAVALLRRPVEVLVAPAAAPRTVVDVSSSSS